MLGITQRMIYKLIDAHRLTVYPTGRRVLLDLDEVRNYEQGFDGFEDQLGDGEPLKPTPSPLSGAAVLPLPVSNDGRAWPHSS